MLLTEMTITIWLGISAGVVQMLGYFLYMKDEKIDPNPVTWFMLAYGTAILTVLEWDANATWSELILPASCAVLGIAVSTICWRKARKINPSKWWPEDWWPEDKFEQLSFLSDAIITVGYIVAWYLATWALLSSENREFAVFTFLFLSNISTFPALYPLIRQTYLDPTKENWKPWAVWTIAYVLLALTTYTIHGTFWHMLMFYPLSNIFLHALVAWLARPSAQARIKNRVC